MANGDCVVGAGNKARIEAIERDQKIQREAVAKVDDKLNKINWWLVALLGGMVVSLALQIAGRVGG